MRLRAASQAVLSIGLALGFAGLFVHLTHALQVGFPAGRAPVAVTTLIHQQRHGALLTGMLLTAAMAMAISLTSGSDPSLRREVGTALLTPAVMFAAIAVCLPFASHRITMFVLLVAFAGIGMYLRRYGARFAALGMLAWAGAFAAFFIHSSVHEGQVGWLAAELAIGAIVSVLIRLLVFLPRWSLDLRLTGRSLVARERVALRRAANHLEQPSSRSLQNSALTLLRLNETALMIDSQTAASPADQAELAARAAQGSFLSDLAISRLVNVVLATPVHELTDAGRSTIASALRALAADEPDRATTLLASLDPEGMEPDGRDPPASRDPVRRIRAAALQVVEVPRRLESPGVAVPLPRPATPLIGGWLPGTMLASARASMQPGRRRLDRVAVIPPLRSAIQLVIAMTLAIIVGDTINGQRFYWAMLAVFVAFMSGNNSSENVQRSVARIAGTTVGIFLGFIAVHLIGDRTGWSVALVLASLFLGFYLNRINYFFFVIGITLMVSQIYEQLGVYSHHLLYLRLEETAAGSAIAIIVMLLVVPLRRDRILSIAFGSYLEGLETFLRAVKDHPVADGAGTELRAEVREIDAAYQTLCALGRPGRYRRRDWSSTKMANLLVECERARDAARAWSQDFKTTVINSPTLNIGDRSAALAEQVRTVRVVLADRTQVEREATRQLASPRALIRRQSVAENEYLSVISASVTALADELAILGEPMEYPHAPAH